MLPAALIVSLIDSRLSAQPASQGIGHWVTVVINSLHHPVAIVACSHSFRLLMSDVRHPTRKYFSLLLSQKSFVVLTCPSSIPVLIPLFLPFLGPRSTTITPPQ